MCLLLNGTNLNCLMNISSYWKIILSYIKGLNKVTDTVIRHLRSPIRKEAPKETVDFCKLGELIKLEKMLSGDVSDSVKMTSICRKQAKNHVSLFSPLLNYELPYKAVMLYRRKFVNNIKSQELKPPLEIDNSPKPIDNAV
uniref:SOCS box domain-containing protein n=1 Tax=Heterorhabditis bacteriophora TaxID=37862 RepID=A0A1I7X2Y9_HETBA